MWLTLAAESATMVVDGVGVADVKTGAVVVLVEVRKPALGTVASAEGSPGATIRVVIVPEGM